MSGLMCVILQRPSLCARPNPTCTARLLSTSRPFRACITPARKAECCALRENPQNTDTPKVSPQDSYTAAEAVSAQLEALRDKDTPWYNHGIQVMYEFGEDVGGLDRSRYFGYGKDLYHFDHFMGEFSNKFKDIIGHDGFKLEQGGQGDTLSEIVAEVATKEGAARVQFTMKVKDIGRNKGRWMTKTIKRSDE